MKNEYKYIIFISGHRFHFAPYTANTDVPIYEQIAFLDRQVRVHLSNLSIH